MNTFFQGMGIGAGLIIAIGAQNAFVLTQGIRKQHHWVIAGLCSLGDILLIFVGTTGLGSVIASQPVFSRWAAIAGTLFLFWLGLRALLRVFENKSMVLPKEAMLSLKGAILTTLALTFLNPHVYVDTVLLLGSIGGTYPTEERYIFALGASLASVLWFFALSLGGTLLATFFQKNIAWKILDLTVCLMMWVIAGQLFVAFD